MAVVWGDLGGTRPADGVSVAVGEAGWWPPGGASGIQSQSKLTFPTKAVTTAQVPRSLGQVCPRLASEL